MAGGSAATFKWRGSTPDSLEFIDVDVQQKGDKMDFIVTRFDFETKKSTQQTNDMMTLPKEYSYGKYVPIIKRKDE